MIYGSIFIDCIIFLYQKTAHWYICDVKYSARSHMIALAPQPSWLQPHPCYLKTILHWYFPGKEKNLLKMIKKLKN